MDKKKQEKRYQELTTAPVRGLILKMAFPTIIGMLVSAVYSITDTFFVSMLGDTTKTASVGMVIGMAANMLLDPLLIFGCHMGVLGAGKADRVKQAFFFCIRTSTAFMLGMAAVIYFAAEQIISCFSADPEVVAMGVRILRWQSVSMPFLAYYILAGMLFQNIGRFLAATIETAMRQGIFYLPLIFLLPVCMGFDGVVLAQPVADILSFICAVPMGIWVFRKNLREEVGKKL